ncbi:MAG: NADH:ubiquinone reductase (Na(+)-transporting) subunit E [Candidatus Brocadia sp.]|nr:NADH:ubiquinone reductase (Na(+)-transporting) subunit E [Candidatus Brocadia sp.]
MLNRPHTSPHKHRLSATAAVSTAIYTSNQENACFSRIECQVNSNIFSLNSYSTTAFNYLIYKYVLVPLGIEYLRLLIFIVIIAAFVQLLEMIVERFSEKLYYALGIFLPLITVNCAILGIALFMLNKPYSFWQAFAFGLGGGFGWFMAIALIGGIREKINESDLPKGLGCPAITLIIIGIMSLAFVGFSGMLKI